MKFFPLKIWVLLGWFSLVLNSQADEEFDQFLKDPELLKNLKEARLCLQTRSQVLVLEKLFDVIKFRYLKLENNTLLWNRQKYQADRNKQKKDFWKKIFPGIPPLFEVYMDKAMEAEKYFPSELREVNTSAQYHLLLGDSLMEFFGNYVKRQKNTPIDLLLNLGIAGEKIEELATRFEFYALFLNPKKFVISIGGNNLLVGCLWDEQYNLEAEKSFATLTSFLDKIQSKYPAQEIILINLPPTGFSHLIKSILKWNTNLNEISSQKIRILDQYRYLSDFNQQKFPLYAVEHDPVHLSDLAYQVIWVPLLNLMLK